MQFAERKRGKSRKRGRGSSAAIAENVVQKLVKRRRRGRGLRSVKGSLANIKGQVRKIRKELKQTSRRVKRYHGETFVLGGVNELKYYNHFAGLGYSNNSALLETTYGEGGKPIPYSDNMGQFGAIGDAVKGLNGWWYMVPQIEQGTGPDQREGNSIVWRSTEIELNVAMPYLLPTNGTNIGQTRPTRMSLEIWKQTKSGFVFSSNQASYASGIIAMERASGHPAIEMMDAVDQYEFPAVKYQETGTVFPEYSYKRDCTSLALRRTNYTGNAKLIWRKTISLSYHKFSDGHKMRIPIRFRPSKKRGQGVKVNYVDPENVPEFDTYGVANWPFGEHHYFFCVRVDAQTDSGNNTTAEQIPVMTMSRVVHKYSE